MESKDWIWVFTLFLVIINLVSAFEFNNWELVGVLFVVEVIAIALGFEIGFSKKMPKYCRRCGVKIKCGK